MLQLHQLEFALLQLQRELNDLMYALESFMIGRLPISLFTPVSLLNILRNVSLQLPEGYSFVIDLNVNNMFLYYEYIKLMAYADFKSIKVVISVPLKTADRHFVLYKIIALPVPILNNTKFVKFTTDFSYFAIDQDERHFLSLNTEDIQNCYGSPIAVCSAEHLIYSSTLNTCEASLYFQKVEARNLCTRRVLSPPFAPEMIRQGESWIYCLPERQLVTFRCPDGQGWAASSQYLQNNGRILNATTCFISGDNFRVFPEFQSKSSGQLTRRNLYLPDSVTILEHTEEETLKHLTPGGVQNLQTISDTASYYAAQDMHSLLLQAKLHL